MSDYRNDQSAFDDYRLEIVEGVAEHVCFRTHFGTVILHGAIHSAWDKSRLPAAVISEIVREARAGLYGKCEFNQQKAAQ